MHSARYLIVGGGMTGDAAVKGIRERDADGSIVLVAAEQHPPYARPPRDAASGVSIFAGAAAGFSGSIVHCCRSREYCRRLSSSHRRFVTSPSPGAIRVGGAPPSIGTYHPSLAVLFASFSSSTRVVTVNATHRPFGEMDGDPTLRIR